MLPPRTGAATSDFCARIRSCFGARIARLVLYGSYARGTATEDSDVDILVVLDTVTPADTREIDALVGDLLTRTGVLLSPLVLSAAEFDALRGRERRLAADIEREGVPL